MPVRVSVTKVSESRYDLKQGGMVVARVNESEQGWKVAPMGCGRLPSRKFWPSAGEAVFHYYQKTATARQIRDLVVAARMPFEVVDEEGRSHGDYPDLDQARGCVEFDNIKVYQIWRGGTEIVESQGC